MTKAKTASIFTVLFLVNTLCFGRDSAYTALRAIGTGDNQALLNHVIQVQGVKGDPQPATWKIVVDDPNARGGVREIEISKGRIVSEHTPVRAYAGTSSNIVMDFKRLNLDSAGAFTIANQEATKHNVGFDSVDYLLRSDDQTNAPVWILKLQDASNVNVGTIYIAADSGAVLRTEGFGGTNRQVRDTYPPSETGPTPANRDSDLDSDRYDVDQPPPGQGVGHQINKGLHRVGASLQEFFTGRRTWDEKFRDEP